MSKKRAVAKIVKPQGIKGEVKLKFLGNTPSELLELEDVYISEDDDKTIAILKSWQHRDSVFMALEGVNSRDDAEKLRGKTLYAKMTDKKLPEGEYFVADLIGCMIVDTDGSELGKLKNILQNGSADVYVVEGMKNFMMPALKRVIKSVDIKAKVIKVDSDSLSEVAVYED